MAVQSICCLFADKYKETIHFVFFFKTFIVLDGLESPASFNNAKMLLKEEVTIHWPNYPAIDPIYTHKTFLTCENLHIYMYVYM